MTHAWKAFLVAPLVIASCDTSSAPLGDLTTDVDTSGPYPVVTSSGIPPDWNLELIVSIGPKSLLETGTPDEFGRVVSALVSPDSEVFVADQLNNEVRVFGLDGEHRRTFGRAGQGPGEFGSLYSIVMVGSQLLALDFGNGRITEFSATGEPLGQRQAPGRVTGSPAQLRFYPVSPAEAYAFSLVSGSDRPRRAFIAQDANGPGDTIFAQDPPAEIVANVVCAHTQGMISFFEVPFGSTMVQHPGRRGVLYSARTHEYRIVVTEPSGDTVRVIARELPPESVTREEWERELGDFTEFLDSTPDAVCDPRRPEMPQVKPFIEDLFVDIEGRLWVQVIRTSGNVWELFDSEGALIARLPVHPGKERAAPFFGRDHFIAIRQDSLDLDHVDVYRIDNR